jgi:hypothetical protein
MTGALYFINLQQNNRARLTSEEKPDDIEQLLLEDGYGLRT